ncbi:MAG: class I SAM-dependent methyltransferase [Caldilineaceae bacterium]|nr:class I SAM-dependent methyltransferase [Caldilineaceae bacterium]
MPELAQLERDLGALEKDQSLYDGDNLTGRFLALKRLDFLAEAYRLRAGEQPASDQEQRVRVMQADLARRNQALYQELRARISAGAVTPHQLRTLFEDNGNYRPGDKACLHWRGEAADALAAGLFRSDSPPQRWNGGDSEMIHYEPAPVGALLELVDRVPMTSADRFVDIGSGLGQVVLLVHLLTGVEAVGLEVMPAFVEQAEQEAAALGVSGVTFEHGDARNADLCKGTVYFLFSPFRGQMLQKVLKRLRDEAKARQLTICSFGPCTVTFAAENWLSIEEPEMDNEFRLAIFHSRGDKTKRQPSTREPARANACRC